jgi:uncharacterized protein YkwD
MFPITVSSIALGTLVLASSAIVISVPIRTTASIPASNTVIRVAQSTTTQNTNDIEQSIFDKINQYRASKGLPALSRDARIDSQSKNHSQNMASGKVPFSHQGFDERVKGTGVTYKGAAENVAYNMGYSDPATQAVQGWLKSPGHLSNIQNRDYNQTGIGVATNSKGEVYFTQIFIRSK